MKSVSNPQRELSSRRVVRCCAKLPCGLAGWRTDLLRRQSNQEGMGFLVFSDEINGLDLDVWHGIPPSELEDLEGVSAAFGTALGIVPPPSHDRLGQLTTQVGRRPTVADVLIVKEGDVNRLAVGEVNPVTS